jgi:hypothetical protein
MDCHVLHLGDFKLPFLGGSTAQEKALQFICGRSFGPFVIGHIA